MEIMHSYWWLAEKWKTLFILTSTMSCKIMIMDLVVGWNVANKYNVSIKLTNFQTTVVISYVTVQNIIFYMIYFKYLCFSMSSKLSPWLLIQDKAPSLVPLFLTTGSCEDRNACKFSGKCPKFRFFMTNYTMYFS